MKFSEGNGGWIEIPKWAEFLLRFGFDWPNENGEPRRISVLSMPSDSAGAALVALGVMIRDLESPDANDIDGHYLHLLRHADRFLNYCSECTCRCNPAQRGCRLVAEISGKIRCTRSPHTGWKISAQSDPADQKLMFERRGLLETVEHGNSRFFYPADHPPPAWQLHEGRLHSDLYSELIAQCLIQSSNLNKSWSGLCLAGRVRGETATKEACKTVRFMNGDVESGLEQLLTIHGWSDCEVSRMTFFNSRTGKLDRQIGSPSIVVADGIDSFLKVVDQAEFVESDIIGVIHRLVDREHLDNLHAKLSELSQWYDEDEDAICGLPPAPRGISIAMFKERR